MQYNIEEIKHKLKKYGQEQLLVCFDKLDEKRQNILLKQIDEIDFDLINSIYNKTRDIAKNEDFKVEPISFIDKYKLNDKYKYYEDIGKHAIKQGKLACVTMAGRPRYKAWS